jgi:hypothetical protein
MSRLPQSARFNDVSDAIKTAPQLYDIYDYAEFTVGNGVSDYDVRTNQSSLFKNCSSAWLVQLSFNKNISVKFNSTDMPSISLGYEVSPAEWRDILKVTNIYITNSSGSSVIVKALLV